MGKTPQKPECKVSDRLFKPMKWLQGMQLSHSGCDNQSAGCHFKCPRGASGDPASRKMKHPEEEPSTGSQERRRTLSRWTWFAPFCTCADASAWGFFYCTNALEHVLMNQIEQAVTRTPVPATKPITAEGLDHPRSFSTQNRGSPRWWRKLDASGTHSHGKGSRIRESHAHITKATGFAPRISAHQPFQARHACHKLAN